MSDLIKRAHELLAAATPGEWGWGEVLAEMADEIERLEKAQVDSTDRDYAIMAEERDAAEAGLLRYLQERDHYREKYLMSEARCRELEDKKSWPFEAAHHDEHHDREDAMTARIAELEAALRRARPYIESEYERLGDSEARRTLQTIDASLKGGSDG